VDEIARENRERWEELARERVGFSVPWLDLDAETARRRVDPEGMLDGVAGRDVLCLAGGGGQQSAAFALLGARVSVLDFAPTQLERDREAAAHHGVTVRLVEGDMRDLSPFPDDAFDVVWHAHSLSFVPDHRPVFREVARVLRPGGSYRLSWTNPFVQGLWNAPWRDGYPVSQPYVDGAEVPSDDPEWDFEADDGTPKRVRGPREFRHGLGAVVNDLLGLGFALLHLREDADGADPGADPGSWKHFKALAPPWFVSWWRLLDGHRPIR